MITSKQMYKLSKRLITAGNFRLWFAEQQRKLRLTKLADKSVAIALNCFDKSKECAKVADELAQKETIK
jgi:hypothetical protein